VEIDTSEELHPVLVADLADAAACATIRGVAARRGVIVVPLVAAPVDRRMHLLEVYVPNEPKPEVFLAEPVGPPNAQGFPLRLEPYGESDPPTEDAGTDKPPTTVKAARGTTNPELTERHTRDLEPVMEPPKTENDTRIGRELAGGKYRLLARVGSGGMGAVYKCHHRDLDKEVAVKVLHQGFQRDGAFSKRFHAEALTMSRIDHPNVTRILDFGEEQDGLLYLAMEFLDGVDLQSLIEQQGPLSLERVVRIMSGVCSGLGHVHRHGIIHRDIKPTNILLVAGLDEEDDTPTEVPKVCDFGIALAHAGPTEGGRVAGTPEYMSPEQARGLELDARSDVYACGIVTYELATGKVPFTHRDGNEVAKMQVFKEPPKPSVHVSDIDPLLEAIIMKALSKDPAKRHPSMRHLRAELRELLAPVMLAAEPSARRSADPAPEESAGEGGGSWLTGRDEQMNSFFTSLADTVEHQNIYHEAAELADMLHRDPKQWLSNLAQMHDVTKFTETAQLLERPVIKFMSNADAPALSAIVTTLRAIIKDEGAIGERAREAGRILRLLRDPPRLRPLVEKALGSNDELTQALSHVLVEPQAAAAEALLEGRQRHANSSARVRFVALMRAIGPAGLPITIAELRASIERGERSGQFVEDLLRAIPPGPNEAAGSVVAEFLKSGAPAVTGAALVALAGLWGQRARALLLGALQNADAQLVMSAVTGLRILRAIDQHVVRRLEPIVSGTVNAPEDLRVAAAAALGEASPEARQEAATIAMRAFNPTSRSTSVWTATRPPPTANPALAVTLARALLSLGVPNAVSIIQERAAGSPDVVRRQLTALIPSK
jgi:serine/threonine-protein kinase